MSRTEVEKSLGFKLGVDDRFVYATLVHLPNEKKYLVDLNEKSVDLAGELFGEAPKGESIRIYFPDYCTQCGICNLCSLASYGKDCKSNSIKL